MPAYSYIGQIVESNFQIYNKENTLVDFTLNAVQQQIDKLKNIDNLKRFSILKPRQKGCSSYIMADFLVECMAGHQTCVMLAHDKDHTERLLRRAQEYLSNLKGPKAKISRMNANEIYFPKTQSTFYIGTAGSKNFGRSATITRLHCSEIAFWDDPKTLLTGLLQAVPKTGVIILETTANGWGNWFQKHYFASLSSQNSFYPFFFPWTIDNEYTSNSSLLYPLTDEEKTIMLSYNCSAEHIQWRREKILEFENDIALFKQEYPLNYYEAFKMTGGSFFTDLELTQTNDFIERLDLYPKCFVLNNHPNPAYTYVLGADSSGGTGNDYAAINIDCIDTMEQVCVFQSNRLASPSFAPIIYTLGKMFNWAYLVPEANSHGLATIDMLKKLKYPLNKLYRRAKPGTLQTKQLSIPGVSYGWQTTQASKSYMIGRAQDYFKNGFKIYDPICFDQLKSFTEDIETSKILNTSDHDDLGIAKMLSFLGIDKVLRSGTMHFTKYEQQDQEEKISSKNVVDISKWRNPETNKAFINFNDIFKPKKGKKFAHG